VFSLAFATSALLYLHRYVFAFIKPTLAEQWGLDNSELGQLDSAFSVCYTVFQFPLGVLADLLGVHLVLTGLILVWCAGMGLMAWAPSVTWLWLSRATVGAGQSAVYACLNRVGRMWYPPAIRTTLQGSVGVLAGRLGALSSSVVFTTLLLGVWGLDWRTAVWILVAVGVLTVLLFAIVFRNSPREHPFVNDSEALLIEGDDPVTGSGRAGETPKGTAVLRTMTPRAILNLIWLSLQNVLSTFADNIYSNWIPLFLAQVHHLKFSQMGLYSALPLLGGALAGISGGMLNDYLIARTGNRRWSRAGVAMVGKGLAAVLMFAALLEYDRPYVFCLYLFFVKFFGDWSLTTSLGVVCDIGGKATASVFAFSNTVAGIAIITAPIVFGYVSKHYGWQPVFMIVGVTYALCALSWLVIDCTIPMVRESKTQDEDG
jgi:ACS family glucarate transporter-like MFS transporter